MADSSVHVLLPAAGRGQRFGDALLKQYAPIAGKPVLAYAIEAVGVGPPVTGITVVLAEDDSQFEKLIAPHFPDVHTVIGGATRAQSVLNGLRAIREIDPDAGWVMVHDAARPCLPRACVRRLLRQGLASADGALLAIPVRDTLKQEGAGRRIERTVERTGLWAAQTPQLFPLARLHAALETCCRSGRPPTDEAAAMEARGARPLLVRGSSGNLKITYPDDILLVEAWLDAGINEEVP